MTEKTIRIPRRAATLIAASGLALGGAAALATGWSASAAQGGKDTVHKVWVCKYVQKPGVNEVLKGGKNPIFVDWHSLTGKTTAPKVGDTFSDAQFKSVVVQIGGTSPGVAACTVVTPPTKTTTPPPSKTTTPPAETTTTTTAPHETPHAVVATTTSAGGGGAAGGMGGVSGGAGGVTAATPGVSAPQTGGDGDSSPANTLLGTGLLASGLALGAGEAIRRRRENATR